MWLLLSVVLTGSLAVVYGQNFELFPAEGTDCTKFHIKIGNFRWPMVLACAKNKVFSRSMKYCVDEMSEHDDCSVRKPVITIRAYEDVGSLCQDCPTCLYPDISNCAGFYNCSRGTPDYSGNLRAFQDECDYPALFDPDTLRCNQDFKKIEAKCGERKLLKAPCDQKKNQCPVSHCRPCQFTYPNCVGKRNGFQEWEGRSFTPFFARCQDGRTLESGTCARSRSGTPRIFSPQARECVDVDGKTFFGSK